MRRQSEGDRLPRVERLTASFTALMRQLFESDLLQDLSLEGVTPAQMAVLIYLFRHPACVVGELAEGLRISYPAATKAIDRLMAKGWVSRRENERDRRLAHLELTASGQTILLGFRAARRARMEAVMRGMAAEDLVALEQGLSGFLRASLAEHPELMERLCERCGHEHQDACLINQAHLATWGSPIQRN